MVLATGVPICTHEVNMVESKGVCKVRDDLIKIVISILNSELYLKKIIIILEKNHGSAINKRAPIT